MHTAYWHQRKDLNPLLRLSSHYDSFSDWPWNLMYRELDHFHAKGKFILTVRKAPEIWFESVLNHSKQLHPIQNVKPWTFKLGDPVKHKLEYINLYEEHNQSIRDYFKDRLEDFLEVCWENNDGWEKLSSFLGRPIPSEPFPYLNKSI